MNSLYTSTVILGHGFAGFAAAYTLQQWGHSPLIIQGAPGATALSWGSVSLESQRFEEELTPLPLPSPTIHQLYQRIEASVYPLLTLIDKPVFLLSPWGTLHPTSLAQSNQIQGGISPDNPPERIGLVYPSQEHLCPHPIEHWNALFKDISVFAFQVPDEKAQKSPFTYAALLETPEGQDRVCHSLRKQLQQQPVDLLLFPAILGQTSTPSVALRHNLESRLGIRCGECLATTPSVPGMRLQTTLESRIKSLETPRIIGQIKNATTHKNQVQSITVQTEEGMQEVRADRFILATGSLLSGGIVMKEHLQESIFRLPILLPSPERPSWNEREVLLHVSEQAHKTHSLFDCGLQVDSFFRPTDLDQLPLFENLYAIGSIIAHQLQPTPFTPNNLPAPWSETNLAELAHIAQQARPSTLGKSFLQGELLALSLYEQGKLEGKLA